MSWWTRVSNVFRSDRLSREIDEELASHLEEAVEQGRDPAEARRALGSALRQREASRDIRLLPWLESLRADAVFSWRQLNKRKATSAAAILSLGLAIGACTAAFRLIDALFLRPLPVAAPEQLYAVAFQGFGDDGKPAIFESCPYPMFRQMRAAVKDQAELLAISWAGNNDLTYGSDQDMEKAYLQNVSGWMFGSFGLRPAAGRLLTEADDLQPKAHAVAVLSYEYWSRRFARDPKVVGRTFRRGNDLYTIVGVAGKGYTGIEPGSMTDVFVPTMMSPYVGNYDANWFRTLVRVRPGVSPEPVREKLQASLKAYREEQVKHHPGAPQGFVDRYVNQKLELNSAATGVSQMKRDYRRPLAALGVLVVLVLLIACANVANLMTAQGALRAREMALRVSIGAGRTRLIQLVLVECAWVGLLAAASGSLFARWSAPFVVARISAPDNPARLNLAADWRVLGFIWALTAAVTLLFGLAPALRASAVKPASTLKGGDDPHARRRTMRGLIAAQSAFCAFVLLAAGLLVATFHRLSNEPVGFNPSRLLAASVVSKGDQPPDRWMQLVERVRGVGGVETVANAGWALMSGTGWDNNITIHGGPPSEQSVWLLEVSTGWLDAMKIPLTDGRDFRANDVYPGVAIVNQTFARQFFPGDSPLGKSFAIGADQAHVQIIGVSGDARYTDLRGPIPPTAYVPIRQVDAKGVLKGRNWGTLMVRTSSDNPLALASSLRREVPRAWPGFRVSNVTTQQELVETHTIRERLLAMLALFFAVVALLLAGIGLYGVLDYSVFQRRREIGIRMAVGAPAADVARRVTLDVFAMLVLGAAAGLGLGLVSSRFIETLLYQVKATDWDMLTVPGAAMLAAALLAALPPVVRAVRIDPAEVLRVE